MSLGACLGAERMAFAIRRGQGAVDVLRLDDDLVSPAAALINAHSAIVGRRALRTARWNGSSIFTRWNPDAIAARTPVASPGFMGALSGADLVVLFVHKALVTLGGAWMGPVSLRLVARDEAFLATRLHLQPVLQECGLVDRVQIVRESTCVWSAAGSIDGYVSNDRCAIICLQPESLDIHSFTDRSSHRVHRHPSLGLQRALQSVAALAGPSASVDTHLWDEITASLNNVSGVTTRSLTARVTEGSGSRRLPFSPAALERGLGSWRTQVVAAIREAVQQNRCKTLMLVGELARFIQPALVSSTSNVALHLSEAPAESFLARGALTLEDSELALEAGSSAAQTPFALRILTRANGQSAAVDLIRAGKPFPARGSGSMPGSSDVRLERPARFAMGTDQSNEPLYEVVFGPVPPGAAGENLDVEVTWELGRSPQFSARLGISKMPVPVIRRIEYFDEQVHRLAPADIAELAVY